MRYDDWLQQGDPGSQWTACPGCGEDVDEGAMNWVQESEDHMVAAHSCGYLLHVYSV